jgi:phosphoglucosamine mutase
MDRTYFGTDGIRGTSNNWPMDAATVLKVGLAAGTRYRRGSHRHRVVVGKDTRLSGYMIEQALTAGFLSAGMDVFLFGPLPTPAVAMLTRSMRADLGVMISASHNPFEDNGIKIFGPDGYKLSDEEEREIEALINNAGSMVLAKPDRLGRAKRIEDAQARYIEFVKRTFPRDLTLSGLRIVVDCANGAAYRVAPVALWELGAEVISIGVEPNGFNINDGCGSTAPEKLQEKVREMRADIGIALDGDGDADRVILVNEKGEVVNGDQLMALIASAWQESGQLKGGGVVATVMSNLGLERYLGGRGLALARTKVGDRYVVEHMRASGCNVGGEQSGHLVLSDFGTTGDGLVAALQVLASVAQRGRPVSEVTSLFTPLPQVLKGVRYRGASPLGDEDVSRAVEAVRQKLGDAGRVLVRASGTEPLIRVMVEGEDAAAIEALADEIVAAVARRAA